MHVPWGWIKQRPHFFAELLSEDYIVDVLYKKTTIVSKDCLLTKRQGNDNLSIRGFRIFPFYMIPVLKWLPLDWINCILFLLEVGSIKKYDYIWITSPSLYRFIKFCKFDKSKIIYDCMDDILEFPSSQKCKTLYKNNLKNELLLLKEAGKVICSAEYLKGKILKRVNIDREILVLNNAISLPLNDDFFVDTKMYNEFIDRLKKLDNVLMYIGTISEWFDFDSISHVLDVNRTVNVVLIGPSDVKIPENSRIHYFGTIERAAIFEIMKYASILVMPFIVTELIKSVNPVKIYEYIYSRKPIIVPQYGEAEKFLKFCHLYESREGFSDLVSKIISSEIKMKASNEEMLQYACANTWEQRYIEIRENVFNEI